MKNKTHETPYKEERFSLNASFKVLIILIKMIHHSSKINASFEVLVSSVSSYKGRS